MREPAGFREAATLYAESYALAPPGSWGRLVGMLKAAVLGGGGAGEAARARELVPAPGSPTAWYAVAIAALVEGDDDAAVEAAGRCARAAPAFERAAAAAAALATGDDAALARAIAAIEADFASRDAHVTGVAIADTALLFATLAERRARGR